jgi:hypothetical protein
MPNIINFEEKVLAALPPEKAAGRLMAIPATERLNILLNRSDAKAVVHALPAQDFYLFVKEIGEERALSLLALAKNSQINHILDLEGWNRDQVQPGKTLAWLEALLKASDQNFLEWLYKVDFELLVTLFKNWLDVQTLPDDFEHADMPDDFPQETIDDQYYFNVKYPQYRDFLKSILNYLFDTHNEFYRDLLNQVIYALESELEELAFQFHRGRLEDNSIPDFEEAATIYQPLGPSGITNRKTVKSEVEHATAAPIFAMMLVPKHDLLTEALALIDNINIRKTLQTEFAALANKVIIADNLASDIPDNLRQAADKATAYVNLALEDESSAEISKAAHLLSTTFIEDLFRLGQAQVKTIYNQVDLLTKSGWLSRWPHGINCLDLEWQEQASLLLADTPMIVRQKTAAHPRHEDLIRTRADLNLATNFANKLSDLAPLFDDLEHILSHTLEQSWDDLDFMLWRKGQLNFIESVTLGNLLLTAAVNKIFLGTWQPTPLPLSKWPEISCKIDLNSIQDVISSYFSETLTSESAIQTAAEYMVQITQSYQQETTPSKDGTPVNPKMVPFFMFTE